MYWKKIKTEKYSPGLYLCFNLEPRAAHISERIFRKIYLFGGWNGSNALNTLDVYYIDNKEWYLKCNPRIRMQQHGNIPSIRNNHACCTLDNSIFVHGGHNGNEWLDDFFLLDTESLVWKEIKSYNYPRARACHTISRINKRIFMFGGYNGEDSFHNIEIFDIETFKWTIPETKGSFPSPRNAHTATVVNKSIFIYGGFCNNFHFNDLYIFNTLTYNWTTPILDGNTPNGFRGHSATLAFNKIYIFGGYDGTKRNNDLYVLSLIEFSLRKISNLDDTICARQKHSATLLSNQKILIFGGYAGNKWLNSVDILDLKVLEQHILYNKNKCILKNNFSLLLNNQSFSDIAFIVEGNKIYCHKCIICARCEYFRNMFINCLQESKKKFIEITNYEFSVFIQLIEYIYTSYIRTTNWKSLLKLYELADAYSYKELKTLCEEYLLLDINSENAVDLMILGYLCNSAVLENLSTEYIIQNKKNINKINNNLNKLMEYPSLMTKILKNFS